MRSPKVNKSKIGKVTLNIPMVDIEEIDFVASHYGLSIENFIILSVAAAVVNAQEDIKNQLKVVVKKKAAKKPVAKKAPAKKATAKKKAPAKKRVAAKKKK